MDEQQAYRILTGMFTNLSAEAEYEIRHDDCVNGDALVRRTD
jgi:hypothetical protein